MKSFELALLLKPLGVIAIVGGWWGLVRLIGWAERRLPDSRIKRLLFRRLAGS